MKNIIKRVFAGLAFAGTIAFILFMVCSFIPQKIEQRNRALLNACIGNLHMLDAAKEQYAMANGLKEGDIVPESGAMQYVKGGQWNRYYCPAAQKNTYTLGAVGVDPSCSIHGSMNAVHFPNGKKLNDVDK
jgi:hypothetical protein